ncbi:hypothetical protein swp_1793 [Shewanella piezotolerans WP3]|uniref:Uncharacterized protein n=1 Tax=Shewanella piezotolerans (strain WP3 / JCM 13877) TaxID=225849 RepID=B8CN56_SHEPW|nr:hypothetical protein swp_1793 [Shewanella piezotolerans WP3]
MIGLYISGSEMTALSYTNQYKDLIAQREFSDFEVRQ